MQSRTSCSAQFADWYRSLDYRDLPEDVCRSTGARILDAIGVTLAASAMPFGQEIRRLACALGPAGQSQILGFPDCVSAGAAALANGAMASAMDFDDTHVETIIHTTSATALTALALAGERRVDGRTLVSAVAGAAELMCRLGMVAPGAMQRLGFHPTAIAGTFGSALVAARLLDLDAHQIRNALGIAGSQAAGIQQAWADGSTIRYVHAGWAALAGIAAAQMARAGITGPGEVFEGRFGLFATHIQGKAADVFTDRIAAGLGSHWETRRVALKPYPCAHVLHSFIDALLYLRSEHALSGPEIERIECPIADYMVPLVCEPQDARRRPASSATARVSLYYTLAEAAVLGRIDGRSYADRSLADGTIADLAARISYRIDGDAPGRERFKGWVIVTTKDGRTLERIEDYNWGSPERPMSPPDIQAKFMTNVEGILTPEAAATIIRLTESLGDVADVAGLAAAGRRDVFPPTA